MEHNFFIHDRLNDLLMDYDVFYSPNFYAWQATICFMFIVFAYFCFRFACTQRGPLVIELQFLSASFGLFFLPSFLYGVMGLVKWMHVLNLLNG